MKNQPSPDSTHATNVMAGEIAVPSSIGRQHAACVACQWRSEIVGCCHPRVNEAPHKLCPKDIPPVAVTPSMQVPKEGITDEYGKEQYPPVREKGYCGHIQGQCVAPSAEGEYCPYDERRCMYWWPVAAEGAFADAAAAVNAARTRLSNRPDGLDLETAPLAEQYAPAKPLAPPPPKSMSGELNDIVDRLLNVAQAMERVGKRCRQKKDTSARMILRWASEIREQTRDIVQAVRRSQKKEGSHE